MLPAATISLDSDKKIVNINEIHLKKHLEDLQKQKRDSGLQISDLTLDKPFRSKAFPLLQSILLNPIKSWTSTTAPQFKSDEGKTNTDQFQFLLSIFTNLFLSCTYQSFTFI